MAAADEDALYCDIAETYHVFDWGALPVDVLARLASGLRENSRIRMKMNGLNVQTDTMLLASIADSTSLLTWFNSEAGRKGEGRPPSMVDAILGAKKKEGEALAFDSPEDFEKARAEILERVKHGD